MATEATKQQPTETEKPRRHRSPNYPAVGLKEAIDRTKKFLGTDGKAGAQPEIAAKHIGFASAHGQAMSVLAALKKFGLVEDKSGRVVPTARAIEIVSLPENDQRRLNAIRDAALLPPIYAELIEQYRATGLPSDETLEGELKAYKGFNPNAVKEFLKGFKETLEFAGLSDLSVLGSESSAEGKTFEPKIGDWIQWESNGSLRFPESKKVVRIDSENGFLYVEGYHTGLPISEVIPAEAPKGFEKPLIQKLRNFDFSGFVVGEKRNPQGVAKMLQDVISLPEGQVVMQWPTPLSQTSIDDLKDWLKIVERRISREVAKPDESQKASEQQSHE